MRNMKWLAVLVAACFLGEGIVFAAAAQRRLEQKRMMQEQAKKNALAAMAAANAKTQTVAPPEGAESAAPSGPASSGIKNPTVQGKADVAVPPPAPAVKNPFVAGKMSASAAVTPSATGQGAAASSAKQVVKKVPPSVQLAYPSPAIGSLPPGKPAEPKAVKEVKKAAVVKKEIIA